MSAERHARVKDIFLAVCDWPPAEWDRKLDRLCADDSDIRSEVELLLEHHEPDPDPQDIDRLRRALEGRYRIDSEIGRGGMAAVYMADDLRHHRTVAVKVLHADLAARLGSGRFLGEIRIAANLVHPHIMPVFDSGEADGFLFYVMPFVSGESLRDRLVRERPLPVHDAVRVAREIAEALAYAHAQGVVHRDVKPENILLEAGQAVLADFGIARVDGVRTTLPGLTPGTPLYMAPEQAAGHDELDGRTDLYSLGCVLYEMLTGDPPFDGSTPQAVLARKLAGPPTRPAARRDTVPPGLDQIVLRALAPVPVDRFESCDAMAEALRKASAPDSKPLRSRVPRRTAWLGAAAAVVVAVVGWATLGWSGTRPRAAVHPRTTQVTTDGTIIQSALSPDGRYLVYTVPDPDSLGRTLIREVGSSTSRILMSRAFNSIEWSSDGTRLLLSEPPPGTMGAYGPEVRTWVVPIVGGESSARAVAEGAYQKWSGDGSRLLGWDILSGTLVIRTVATGQTDTLRIQEDIDFLHDADLSADGRRVAFVGGPPTSEHVLGVIDLDTGRERILRREPEPLRSVRWGQDGEELLYWQGHEIWRLAITRAGAARGEPTFLLGDLTTFPLDWEGVIATFRVAMNGRRIGYTRYRNQQNLWLYERADPNGAWERETRLTDGSTEKSRPSFSPEGRLVAYTDDGGARGVRNIFVLEPATRIVRQITFSESEDINPVWSPDGRHIAYASRRGSELGVWVVGLDGDPPRRLGETILGPDRVITWAPGREILAQLPGNRNFAVVDPVTGAAKPLVAGNPPGWMFNARYAPDGRRVVIKWNRPDPDEDGLWLIDLEGGSRTQISNTVHLPYVWSSDGRIIAFDYTSGGELIAVPEDGGDPVPMARPPCPMLFQLSIDPGLTRVLCPKDRPTKDAVLVDLGTGG